MADSPYIVTVTAENFHQVVIDGSHQQPVLVDFWADWCAPCRGLMPVLAKLADEYDGRFILAKLDTEAEPEFAAQFGIRSLPTVQLFKDGAPVDEFMGALPETQVREFLDRHIERESDKLLVQAQSSIESGDLEGAAALIEQIRASEPNNTHILLAEIQLKAKAGDTQAAEAMIDRLPLDLINDPGVAALRGQLRFASALADAPTPDKLAERLSANPGDSEARYQLAAHRVTRGDMEDALENLFELIKTDRAYGDDAGRKGMLMVFDLLGSDSPLATRYRSKMMTALY